MLQPGKIFVSVELLILYVELGLAGLSIQKQQNTIESLPKCMIDHQNAECMTNNVFECSFISNSACLLYKFS